MPVCVLGMGAPEIEIGVIRKAPTEKVLPLKGASSCAENPLHLAAREHLVGQKVLLRPVSCNWCRAALEGPFEECFFVSQKLQLV